MPFVKGKLSVLVVDIRRPLAVIRGAPRVDAWKVLRKGDGWTQYHIGTLDLELFTRETEGYKSNLSNPEPKVYVILRPAEDVGEH